MHECVGDPIMTMKELKFTDTLIPHKTTIIVAPDDVNLNSFDLTPPEKEYILNRIAKETANVAINKYGYWNVFVFPEKKKSHYSIKEGLRNQAYSVLNLLARQEIEEIQVLDGNVDKDFFLAFLEGLCLSSYKFEKYLSNKDEKASSIKTISVISNQIDGSVIEELEHIVKAVYTARDLVNEPSSFLTSLQLSKEIQKMGNEAGFEVEVFNKEKITELKMGGILAVNKGSSEPPTFSVMKWKPGNAVNAKPFILVGKGIVYDTGGLSLKPTPDSMDYMKSDMAGAAAVAGVMYSVAKAKLPLYVIALAPSTDNRLDAHSYSPGDVITMHNGSTVEVLNTDAEGRLILADALSYATQFDPQLVITVATLTGAAHRAIGDQGMVGMGNANPVFFDALEEAGLQVYERIARFPFWEEYAEMIKSDIADLKNIGGDTAGAITAGKFLEYFTNYPFIHLDIAGIAFNKKNKTYKGKGASGACIRLLYHFLKNQVLTQVR